MSHKKWRASLAGTIESDSGVYVGSFAYSVTRDRVIDEHNAMLGIENPGEAISAARDFLRADTLLNQYWQEDASGDMDDDDGSKRIDLEEKFIEAKDRALAALGETGESITERMRREGKVCVTCRSWENDKCSRGIDIKGPGPCESGHYDRARHSRNRTA